MESKHLKHCKRSKSTTGHANENTDVIVVPPDILKKLGINIGNSNPVQKNTNFLNPVQCPVVKSNATEANTTTAGYIKKPCESSMVETANLMKKSVFLSPTFVTTVTNVIPGEVEISENKHFNNSGTVTDVIPAEVEISENIHSIDSGIDRHLALDNIEGKNNISVPIAKSESSQNINNVIMLNNGYNTNEAAFLQKTIKASIYDVKVDNININKISNIAQAHCVKEISLSKKDDHISLNTNDHTVKEVYEQHPKIDKSEGAANAIIKSEIVNNNLILFQESVRKTYQTKDILSKHEADKNIVSQKLENENNILIIEERIKDAITEHSCVSLKENISTHSESGNNLVSLQHSINTEINPNLVYLKESANQIFEDEAENNLDYSEGAVHKITLDKIEDDSIHLECNTPQLKPIGAMYNMFSAEQGAKLNQMHHKVENITSYKENIVNQAHNSYISFEATTGQIKETIIYNKTNSSDTVVEECKAEKKIVPLTVDASKNNEAVNQSVSLENDNCERICLNDFKDLQTYNDKNMFKEIKVNSGVVVNSKFTFIPNGCLTEISEEETTSKIEEAEIDANYLYSNNNKDSSTQKNTSSKLTDSINDLSALTKTNKSGQKINIISEEIISPAVSKEFRSQSPIVKKISPLPLNTIIGMKKNYDITFDSVVTSSQYTKFSYKSDMSFKFEASTSEQLDYNIAPKYNFTIPVLTEQSCSNKNNLDLSLAGKENLKSIVVPVDENNDNTIIDFNYGVKDGGANTVSNSCKSQKSEDEALLLTANLGKYCEKDKEITGLTPENLCIDKNLQSRVYDDGEKTSDKVINCNGSDFEMNIAAIYKSDKNQSNSTYIAENEQYNKEKRNADKEIDDKISHSDDKLPCKDELNNILNSRKNNSDGNMNSDKVKEIAEYIKKFAHMYRGSKKRLNRKTTNNLKSTKPNTIKSKLSFQGVEKPGGDKRKFELISESKILKTYTKQRKTQISHTPQNTSAKDENISLDIDYAFNSELNTVDITKYGETQSYCVCYDFGHLYDCDNSYEHIHFWFPNSNADLKTIISIYSDEDAAYTDRTHLDSPKITLNTINETTGNICWNYFSKNKKESHHEVSVKSQIINDCKLAIRDKTFAECPQKECISVSSKISHYDSSAQFHTQSVSQVIDCDENTVEQENDSVNPTIDGKILLKNNNFNSDNTLITINDMQEQPRHTRNDLNTESCSGDAVESVDKADNINNSKSTKSYSPKIVDRNTMDVKESMATSTPGNTKILKRSFSARNSPEAASVSLGEPSSKKTIKCGVCNILLSEAKWECHVSNQHCYIAWRAGSSLDFDDSDLFEKLQQRLQTIGHLKCSNCNMQTKKTNKFLFHVKKCVGQQEKTSRRASSKTDTVVCGVCRQSVPYLSWIEHIGKEHNYLAWIEGQHCLDMEDETAITKHLQRIIKTEGGLLCYKCGLNNKRAKLYLDHIKTCDGSKVIPDDFKDDSIVKEDGSDKKEFECGVCNKIVPISEWNEHIGKEHNYLAWKVGSSSLDLNDEDAVKEHLLDIIRNGESLICYKCGLNRRRAKLYLSHVQSCDGSENHWNNSIENVNLDSTKIEETIEENKIVKCAVCEQDVPEAMWIEHIGKEHQYLAWQQGGEPLDVNDEDAVKEHLLDIIRNGESLICYKCGLNRRRAKLYLTHVKSCDGSENNLNDSSGNVTLKSEQIDITIDPNKIVKCAVCEQDVPEEIWIEHIGKEHQYLAWQQGEEPLNIEDEDEIKQHLLNIVRENDCLICYKCHVTKKYPKSFRQHIKECSVKSSLNNSKLNNELDINHFDVSDVTSKMVTCGVCNKEVKTSAWMSHIEERHNYVAWFVGKPPLDLNDSAMVQKHLTDVSKTIGGLKCPKCARIRKYAKSYLYHVNNCDETNSKVAASLKKDEIVECAVCSEKMEYNEWRKHAMNKHYNVAWMVGDPPIDINLPYVVEPYIKEYQHKHDNKLVCKTCGASRVSAVGFYAHIITCGKTEEEIDVYRSVCQICNNKYLRIYKSQHMTMHKEKELATERKLLIAKEKELKKQEFDEPVEIVAGRRKAAEKAITVIEKYTSTNENGRYCPKCGFNSDVESEMANHVCVEKKFIESDSDVSIDLDINSEDDDDDDDTDIDSNISEEEREARYQELYKSKKHGDSAHRVQRLPFEISNINSYMRKSAEEFVEMHFTQEDLFTEWHKCEYEIVSDTELTKFMPPIEESCKLIYDGKKDWIVYKRFEARREKNLTTMFTGTCIQSICWVPPHLGDNSGSSREYLSVVTHLSDDVPKHFWNDKPITKPALVQIWDCGNLSDEPECVMGIALEYGTLWALDWCPSGARDLSNTEVATTNETYRLGLFAAAFSNGCAYVFSVPYPSTIKEKDKMFCKLKPVAELRLTMNTNRKTYQATAVRWSMQKGHAHVVVGYADGTIAYYDLKNESPLLKAVENGVTIIYPYFDERGQGMCIEDVDIFPTRDSCRGLGAVVGGSVGGAGVSAGRFSTLQTHSAAVRVLFPPHWPAPLLAGDDNLVSQAVNELEWWGGGRRLGGMRACCGCSWCGRIAHTSTPLVRLVRVHPAHQDQHRQIIAMVQMIPLGNKRKRKNDELSMTMEPLTYNDAVVKYGVEFKLIMGKDKHIQQRLSGTPRESFPERFPLADVTSMMFCPSPKNHHKLALAIHAGFVFIMNV